jgi:hypothetical protein
MREEKSRIDRKICTGKPFADRTMVSASSSVDLGCALSVSAGKPFAAQGISRSDVAVKICYQPSAL